MKLFKTVNMKRLSNQPWSTNGAILKLHHLLILALLVGFSGVTYSAGSESQAREQLMEIEEQLELQTENIKQQKTSIKSMEQSLECTYNLLQNYNVCEEEHEKNSEDYISCMGKAKSQNTTCLGSKT